MSTLKIGALFADDCQICDRPLGTVAVKKVRRGYVHLACWMAEKS